MSTTEYAEQRVPGKFSRWEATARIAIVMTISCAAAAGLIGYRANTSLTQISDLEGQLAKSIDQLSPLKDSLAEATLKRDEATLKRDEATKELELTKVELAKRGTELNSALARGQTIHAQNEQLLIELRQASEIEGRNKELTARIEFLASQNDDLQKKTSEFDTVQSLLKEVEEALAASQLAALALEPKETRVEWKAADTPAMTRPDVYAPTPTPITTYWPFSTMYSPTYPTQHFVCPVPLTGTIIIEQPYPGQPVW